ncbi:NAD(+) diphosphatase [Paracoccus benzoatiresistens]|uniref:NAD(+) diphosphatase n=1 Tax=Paracoccus benzoatiresistens TaxID=2997341 RepID=A0ABT4JA59_9RHOB|nr:NAD(+) diphosphatase [Paracoccus sp. EF6]MCZ0964009.1 NAD(+) diphosphatase [Paracoccus sp. EF6]
MIRESEITFAGSYLDRADRLRGNADALAGYLADPATRVLPFWQGKPLFEAGPGPRLAWLPSGDPLVRDRAATSLFLGLDADGIAHFAVDLSGLAPPDGDPATVLGLPETRQFVDLRAVLPELNHRDAGIAAPAKGIFEWRRSHGFCSNCGARNVVAHAGWRFDCPACKRPHFPRTDPVVIMLVLDGDRVLLGRQPGWDEGMYSLLAGFIEPGESVEEAVRREVHEESAIRIGDVRYLTSQPWPFPASLMIGCVARAVTSAITIDPSELEHALWADKAEIADALAGRHERIRPARKGSIAQAILRAWVEGRVPGFQPAPVPGLEALP